MANVIGADLFVETARNLCAWIEGQAHMPAAGTRTALRLLSTLYSEAINLPNGNDSDIDLTSNPTQDEYAEMQQRFSEFTVHTFYTHDPSVAASTSKPDATADVIAVVYKHIKHGLSLYEAGEREAAIHYWYSSFVERWGYPLSVLINALHQYADRNNLLKTL